MKNKIKFDPDAYTITIRKEKIDDEFYFVGRVAELPNITAFENTYEDARSIVIDAIQTFKVIADETGAEFPLPYPVLSNEFSGRLTLRLPKSLHAKISHNAAQENISVNQYLTAAVAAYVGEAEGLSKIEMLCREFAARTISFVISYSSGKNGNFTSSNLANKNFIALSSNIETVPVMTIPSMLGTHHCG